MTLSVQPQQELLMVGMSAKTYRIGNVVRKECHVLPGDSGITKQNLDSCKTEAEVYLILGSHRSIAKYLSTGPNKSYLELEYYPNGNLKEYLASNRANITDSHIRRWAYQMIESVAYIHSKKVRHSDIRLEQWLVDHDMNARLSDFNGSGFDDQPALALKGRMAQGLERSSHYLPRDPDEDNTVELDLFALGSALYELVTGHYPYEGLEDELIETYFQEEKFPPTEGLFLGSIIRGCWQQKFISAQDVLDASDTSLIPQSTQESSSVISILESVKSSLETF